MSLLPLCVPWLAGAVMLFAHGGRRWLTVASALVIATVGVLDAVLLMGMVLGGHAPTEVVTGGWPAGVGIRLRVDALATAFGVVCAAVLTAVLAHEAWSPKCSRFFCGLILLLAAGLHGAFFTGDLFNFYVFFELSVVTSFVLAAEGFGRAEVRVAFVYAAVNIFGSVLFLLGVASVYHANGTLDLEELTTLSATGGAQVALPAVIIFVALSLKLGLFPFHGWVPVLYRNAKPVVVAALSGALFNLAAYGLIRLGFSVFESTRQRGAMVLWALGLAAAVYGALLALRRTRAAEIAAYASIVHAGYVVVGVGIGGAHGVAAVLLTVFSGSLDKCILFLTLDSSVRARGGLALVAACSVAGLPVTLGFVSKLQLFRAAAEPAAAWLVMVGLLVSVVLLLAAVFRYRHLVVRRPAPGPGRSAWVPAASLAFASVSLGAVAGPVVEVAWPIALEIAGAQ